MLIHRRATLRDRLTLWCTAALLTGLAIYAAIVYVSLRRVLWSELDERLHHEIETVEGLLQPFWTPGGVKTPGGGSPLDDDDDRWLEVWSLDGRLLFQSGVAKARPIEGLAPPREDAAVSRIGWGTRKLRIKNEQGHIAGDPVIVRVATPEDVLRAELTAMIWVMGVALIVCGAIGAYGVYRLARHTLAPVGRLVTEATAITADRLGDRLTVENADDEVGQIARAFNATLARLEASFARMRTFTANASHELRTPVTALRAAGQVALTEARGDRAYREAIGSMLEDADQLARLLDTLLLLARADADRLTLNRETVDLGALAADIVDQCGVLAEEKSQTLSFERNGACAVRVDPTVIRIAIANLVHNAIRYGPSGSAVTARVTLDSAALDGGGHADRNGAGAGARRAIFEVQDHGPGIDAAHHAHLFDRFYRVDRGRTRDEGGVGLGLALARWAVDVHGGEIGLHSAPGKGSTFYISLPLAPLHQHS
jgi:signal transduction histidine kinase